MWISLTDSDADLVELALRSLRDARADELLLRLEKERIPDPVDAVYRDAVETSDELEVDDDAVVSAGADSGAWVHAWVWVSNDKAGISDEEDDDNG